MNCKFITNDHRFAANLQLVIDETYNDQRKGKTKEKYNEEMNEKYIGLRVVGTTQHEVHVALQPYCEVEQG